MHEKRIPEWLRHAPAPGIRGFATLTGLEAVARGILISVYPLALYRAIGDAQTVSALYFSVGLVSLVTGLMVPWAIRFMPRHLIYGTGLSLNILGASLAIGGGAGGVISALALNTVGTVMTFVCLNAYVLDYVARVELGRCETSRMLYSALGWTLGPVAGVTLMAWSEPAPFVVSAVASVIQLATFLYMRLGRGKLITRAHRPPPNPLAFLPRFFAQPRLVAGWLFAVIRSCGWWVYVVYLPIFAVQSGLGDKLGGQVLSLTNAGLFAAPLILKWMQRRSLRQSVRAGFGAAGALFLIATLTSGLPAVSVLILVAASFCLIVLDVCAGLPFLMAVKPSERTEMSAIYSSFRDVSGIATPGLAWLVLLVAPVPGIFAAGGAALLMAWAIAGRLHPRLGRARRPLQTAG